MQIGGHCEWHEKTRSFKHFCWQELQEKTKKEKRSLLICYAPLKWKQIGFQILLNMFEFFHIQLTTYA